VYDGWRQEEGVSVGIGLIQYAEDGEVTGTSGEHGGDGVGDRAMHERNG